MSSKTICTRCIYDDTIPMINFDEKGVCNYCRQYDSMCEQYPIDERGTAELEKIVEKMKRDGQGKPYDVVIGVSGGCDSSYMLHLAHKMGLRVLAAHFDNTWNAQVAVDNVRKLQEKLGFDLFTHVVDPDEYNDVFRSFMLASVPEIDTPSDIALATVHYMAAAKYGIKYIWEGHSFRTEGVSPVGWFYMDAKYIKGIQKKFGTKPIKTLPLLTLGKWMKWMCIDKIKKIRPLYYVDYRKEEVKQMLHDVYGWEWYGGHHMENRTSYFTNNYYLPKKFGIDLRYCEFSAKVRVGSMDRDKALREIQTEKPFIPELLDEVKEKLHFTDEEFAEVMSRPCKSYRDYPTYKHTFERMRPIFWLLYRLQMVPRSFYDKFTKKDLTGQKTGKK